MTLKQMSVVDPEYVLSTESIFQTVNNKQTPSRTDLLNQELADFAKFQDRIEANKRAKANIQMLAE